MAFQFREDGYFNMTKAAKHFSKEMDDFWRNSGIFVDRELVFAYGMWISPSLHLKAIRIFDELHTKGMVMTPAVAQQVVESLETFLARAVLVAHESLEAAKKELAAANAKTIEQAKKFTD